ncbi:trichohyalin-like [Gouania willdenowi]|uniref:trichohyalin-like n=1 Tax=Gouania willdenowi TaxID=441366 RepID=UPI0010561DED|nr:trichohyalin-like [Gouania willdenowi]
MTNNNTLSMTNNPTMTKQQQGEKKMTSMEKEQELVSFLKSCTSDSERVLALREALLEYRESYKMAEKDKAILQHTVWNNEKQMNALLEDNKAMVCKLENAELIQVQNVELVEEVLSLRKALHNQQEETQKVNTELQKSSSEIQTLKSALHSQQKDAAKASKQLQDRDKTINHMKTSAEIKMATSNEHWSRRMAALKQQVASEKIVVCRNSPAQINQLHTRISSLQGLLQSQMQQVVVFQKQQLEDKQKFAKAVESHEKAMNDSHAQWDERWSTREEEMHTSISNLQSQHEQRMDELLQEQQDAEKLVRAEREALTNRNVENLTKISALESQLIWTQAEWSDKYKTLQEQHLSMSKATEQRTQQQMEALIKNSVELQELDLKTEKKGENKEATKRRQRELKEREMLEKKKVKDLKKEEKEKTGEGKLTFFWQKLARKSHHSLTS